MRRARWVAAGLGAVVVSCGSSTERVPHTSEIVGLGMPRESVTSSAPALATSASSTPKSPGDSESDERIARALDRVALARHLPIKRVVHGRRLGRGALLEELKKKMAEEIPPGVIRLQGEAYRALELVPVDYDFEAGILKLLQSQIAGYYDPDDRTMYLLDDLKRSLEDETLNHELVHALQDQSFDLGPMLKYRAGKGDESSAYQTLVEGDAVSGMLDASGTPANDLDEDVLAAMFKTATDLSAVGLETPGFIRDSLVSPYIDGFKFVQALRRRNDWDAVDEAFKRKPISTEQILHVDKFLANEVPLDIGEPTITPLGQGFTSAYVDTMGENGFRLAFVDRGPRDMSEAAAAGWGGDKFVVAEKTVANQHVYGLAMRLRMDTARDAQEIDSMLAYWLVTKAGGKACRERADLGPVAWSVRGRDAAIVAGPYKEEGGTFTSASTCAEAQKWLASVLAQP